MILNVKTPNYLIFNPNQPKNRNRMGSNIIKDISWFSTLLPEPDQKPKLNQNL